MLHSEQTIISCGRSLSEIPDPFSLAESSTRPPRRLESKVNKNLVKLRPICLKKNIDDPLQSEADVDQKAKVPSIELDPQSSTEEDKPDDQPNMGSSGKILYKHQSIEPRPCLKNDGEPTIKLKKNSTFEISSPNIFKFRGAKTKDILYKPSEIQNATSFSEARLMMVGLPLTTTNASVEEAGKKSFRFSVGHRLVLKNECTSQKTKDQIDPPLKDPVSMPELRQIQSTSVGMEPFKNLVFSPSVDEKTLYKHAINVLRGLTYSIRLLKPPPLSYVQFRQVLVRELKDKSLKTLLLDLDETLVHACPSYENPDKIISLTDGSGSTVSKLLFCTQNTKMMIKIRPYAREFLRKMREHFEIIVYTASITPYAEAVVKELDPDNKYISYILDRSLCLETKNGFFIKDLRIIKNRDLKSMIMVDNLVHSFGFQIDNGIPILEWKGDKKDQELKYLMDYLLEAKKFEDVREYNRKTLKLAELINYTPKESL